MCICTTSTSLACSHPLSSTHSLSLLLLLQALGRWKMRAVNWHFCKLLSANTSVSFSIKHTVTCAIVHMFSSFKHFFCSAPPFHLPLAGAEQCSGSWGVTGFMDINHPLPDQSTPLRNSNGGRECMCVLVCVWRWCAREGKPRQTRIWQDGETE